MAKLDRKIRERMQEQLKDRLPSHWHVSSGVTEYAYVEVDQDGERPESRFPEVGSIVIEATNGLKDVVVTAYTRVKCPPGYPEARKPTRTLCEYGGVGWMQKTINVMVEHALEADKDRPAPGPF